MTNTAKRDMLLTTGAVLNGIRTICPTNDPKKMELKVENILVNEIKSYAFSTKEVCMEDKFLYFNKCKSTVRWVLSSKFTRMDVRNYKFNLDHQTPHKRTYFRLCFEVIKNYEDNIDIVVTLKWRHNPKEEEQSVIISTIRSLMPGLKNFEILINYINGVVAEFDWMFDPKKFDYYKIKSNSTALAYIVDCGKLPETELYDRIPRKYENMNENLDFAI